MIEEYLIELSRNYPWLIIPYIVIMALLALSMITNILLTIVLVIITKTDKNDIFSYFVNNSSEKYRNLLGMKIGGWLMNMEIPFFYWRLFSVRYGMKKEEVKGWRNIVKDSFEKKQYVVFRIRVIAKQCFLLIAIPLVMIISIDMILAN
ncbi:hypothetical protein WAX88_20895 (plasmid) [Photobacterium damselae subsp. damselae]|uniref:hypothetical protein n=1 Tax=Photobacterium damselae TaxID=38293 RepID=UPI00311B1B7B